MKPELKAKWVAALRSGKYEQGQESLYTMDGYCCLGVLLDVSEMGSFSDWNVFDLEDGGSMDGDLGQYGPNVFGVPANVEQKLINMNDVENKNFNEIADYIESVL